MSSLEQEMKSKSSIVNDEGQGLIAWGMPKQYLATANTNITDMKKIIVDTLLLRLICIIFITYAMRRVNHE
ncbi:hypothetical protein G9P44_000447 [Scheffersomyces stipitis]|nr:hypothetical protein G9P44_000447 [Scheffersomyces stipitis]